MGQWGISGAMDGCHAGVHSVPMAHAMARGTSWGCFLYEAGSVTANADRIAFVNRVEI